MIGQEWTPQFPMWNDVDSSGALNIIAHLMFKNCSMFNALHARIKPPLTVFLAFNDFSSLEQKKNCSNIVSQVWEAGRPFSETGHKKATEDTIAMNTNS